jgi:hypothetical protein
VKDDSSKLNTKMMLVLGAVGAGGGVALAFVMQHFGSG